VAATAHGTLAVGAGGRWRSQVLRLGQDGHGTLQARGAVIVETPFGSVRGGPGTLQW
jgi:hypothetical protein